MGTSNGAIPRHKAYLLRLSFVSMLFIFASIDNTSALGRFRNGRYDDGFLGEPSKFESLRRKPEPEDKWFEQKLDHFGGKSKELTWKQVCTYKHTHTD